VEAQVKALLATADEDTSINFQLCDVTKQTQSLKLGKAYGFDGIPNESLWHLPKRTLVHLAYLFNHCLQLGHFLASWKEEKIITLPKPIKDPKCTQNLCLIRVLPTTCKMFEKLILRTQKHTEERNLLNACQFGF
jgi:hypothetical protein